MVLGLNKNVPVYYPAGSWSSQDERKREIQRNNKNEVKKKWIKMK